MERVLRLETERGVGMYCAAPSFRDSGPTSYAKHRPEPRNDELAFSNEYRFGFYNFTELLEWTTSERGDFELGELVQYDIGLAEYEAQEVRHGYRQVAFIPARRLCWIPLSELVS